MKNPETPKPKPEVSDVKGEEVSPGNTQVERGEEGRSSCASTKLTGNMVVLLLLLLLLLFSFFDSFCVKKTTLPAPTVPTNFGRRFLSVGILEADLRID